MVEKLGRRGKSRAEIAAALKIAKSTLYLWASEHAKFSDALARAKTAEQAHWEEIGERALGRKHFQANVWRMSMAARFPGEYSKKGREAPSAVKLVELIGEFQPSTTAVTTEVKQVPCCPRRE